MSDDFCTAFLDKYHTAIEKAVQNKESELQRLSPNTANDCRVWAMVHVYLAMWTRRLDFLLARQTERIVFVDYARAIQYTHTNMGQQWLSRYDESIRIAVMRRVSDIIC